jgi:hypothetical protein
MKSLSVLLRKLKILRTEFVEKIKVNILRSGTLIRKSCHLCNNVDEFCTAGQATDDNKAHAHCMLDN